MIKGSQKCLVLKRCLYSSTCHERPPPVRSESGPSWQVAAGYRDINTAKTVVGTLQKWAARAGGRSPNSPAVAGATVSSSCYAIGLYRENAKLLQSRVKLETLNV